MPVTMRGNSWQATVNHKSERYRRQFETKKEALAWEADSKARLLRGELPCMGDSVTRRDSTKPYTLGELIEHVYKTHWAPQAGGEKQLINGRSIAKLIGPNTPVARVGRLEIDKARAALLSSGNSPATVNRKVAALSKALSIAVDMDIISSKPKTVKYKEAEHRIRRFTPTEEASAIAFFDHIGNDDMRDYVLVSLDTGCRQGEVLQLAAQDVDERKLTVWGTGSKSGKSRSVPLTSRAREILMRRKKGKAGRAKLFGDLTRASVAHFWGRFAEAMNLQDDKQFVPHIMRHEFCSRLADKNLNAAVIKELAGHSTLAVTQRYIHIGAQALIDAIASLEVHAAKPLADIVANAEVQQDQDVEAA